MISLDDINAIQVLNAESYEVHFDRFGLSDDEAFSDSDAIEAIPMQEFYNSKYSKSTLIDENPLRDLCPSCSLKNSLPQQRPNIPKPSLKLEKPPNGHGAPDKSEITTNTTTEVLDSASYDVHCENVPISDEESVVSDSEVVEELKTTPTVTTVAKLETVQLNKNLTACKPDDKNTIQVLNFSAYQVHFDRLQKIDLEAFNDRNVIEAIRMQNLSPRPTSGCNSSTGARSKEIRTTNKNDEINTMKVLKYTANRLCFDRYQVPELESYIYTTVNEIQKKEYAPPRPTAPKPGAKKFVIDKSSWESTTPEGGRFKENMPKIKISKIADIHGLQVRPELKPFTLGKIILPPIGPKPARLRPKVDEPTYLTILNPITKPNLQAINSTAYEVPISVHRIPDKVSDDLYSTSSKPLTSIMRKPASTTSELDKSASQIISAARVRFKEYLSNMSEVDAINAIRSVTPTSDNIEYGTISQARKIPRRERRSIRFRPLPSIPESPKMNASNDSDSQPESENDELTPLRVQTFRRAERIPSGNKPEDGEMPDRQPLPMTFPRYEEDILDFPLILAIIMNIVLFIFSVVFFFMWLN